jgi:hypothetical protein
MTSTGVLGRPVGSAPAEIRLDPPEQLVVRQQPVQLAQLRLKVGDQLGHHREQVLWRIAIDYHDTEASGPRWERTLHPSPEALFRTTN